jgi:hypothetical protein
MSGNQFKIVSTAMCVCVHTQAHTHVYQKLLDDVRNDKSSSRASKQETKPAFTVMMLKPHSSPLSGKTLLYTSEYIKASCQAERQERVDYLF